MLSEIHEFCFAKFQLRGLYITQTTTYLELFKHIILEITGDVTKTNNVPKKIDRGNASFWEGAREGGVLLFHPVFFLSGRGEDRGGPRSAGPLQV